MKKSNYLGLPNVSELKQKKIIIKKYNKIKYICVRTEMRVLWFIEFPVHRNRDLNRK